MAEIEKEESWLRSLQSRLGLFVRENRDYIIEACVATVVIVALLVYFNSYNEEPGFAIIAHTVGLIMIVMAFELAKITLPDMYHWITSFWK